MEVLEICEFFSLQLDDSSDVCDENCTLLGSYVASNNPEERSSHLLRGGSLKSRMIYVMLPSKLFFFWGGGGK
jgi:hypothetical protein